MQKSYDVLIIGASLAGASAAIRLGRSGLKVALIDKASFPRRKPCGEGLSSFGLQQLERLGVKDSILQLPHLKYHGYRIKAGRSSSIVKSPWTENITIQRSLLDDALLSKALEFQNITPFLSQQVIDVSSSSVKTEVSTFTANRIIMACGSTSSLLNKIPHKAKRFGPKRSGVTVTFKGEYLNQPRYINIILKKDFEIYCTPLAQGRLNVSILKHSNNSLNLRELIFTQDILNEVFEECSFNGSMELSPQGRINIGNVRRVSAISTISLAGDAKEEFDPIGGMGMSHALCSGIQEADRILRTIHPYTGVSSRTYSYSNINSMRLFTSLTYRTFMSAKYFPSLLSVVASPFSHSLLKFIAKESA